MESQPETGGGRDEAPAAKPARKQRKDYHPSVTGLRDTKVLGFRAEKKMIKDVKTTVRSLRTTMSLLLVEMWNAWKEKRIKEGTLPV